jgi:hypothetical protein
MLQTTEWEAVPGLRTDAALDRELETVLQSSLHYHLDRELKAAPFLHAPGIE